jgi:hypothetical protein
MPYLVRAKMVFFLVVILMTWLVAIVLSIFRWPNEPESEFRVLARWELEDA